MSDKIPPRPWRVVQPNATADILDAKGRPIISHVDPWFAHFIVRLVNAEAQAVEAVRMARNGFVSCYTKVGNVRAWRGTAEDIDWLTKTLDSALALLRGDRPAEGGRW